MRSKSRRARGRLQANCRARVLASLRVDRMHTGGSARRLVSAIEAHPRRVRRLRRPPRLRRSRSQRRLIFAAPTSLTCPKSHLRAIFRSSDQDGWRRASGSHRQLKRPKHRCCGVAQDWRRSSSRRPSWMSWTAPLPGFIRARSLLQAAKGRKRAMRVVNDRQVLAQDAVAGGVDGLVSDDWPPRRAAKSLWLKTYQAGHVR